MKGKAEWSVSYASRLIREFCEPTSQTKKNTTFLAKKSRVQQCPMGTVGASFSHQARC
jgi:hypothetical protein